MRSRRLPRLSTKFVIPGAGHKLSLRIALRWLDTKREQVIAGNNDTQFARRLIDLARVINGG